MGSAILVWSAISMSAKCSRLEEQTVSKPDYGSRWTVVYSSSPHITNRWLLLQVGDKSSACGYHAYICRWTRNDECSVAKWIQGLYDEGIISHSERMRLSGIACGMIIEGNKVNA